MTKVLIVGDTHGDWGPLNNLMNKKRPDIVLQVGDFGWWPALQVAHHHVHKLKSWTHMGLKVPEGTAVYWCDGNHEDHDDLDRFMVGRDWRVPQEIYERVHYCPRGSTLTLPDGRTVCFFGGADSIDKYGRRQGISWFPQEIPRYHEVERALSLETPIDIMITHTVPEEWVPDICRAEKLEDPTRKMLSALLEKHKPPLWFSGHWHHEATGRHEKTNWFSLDYSGHGGRWWVEL